MQGDYLNKNYHPFNSSATYQLSSTPLSVNILEHGHPIFKNVKKLACGNSYYTSGLTANSSTYQHSKILGTLSNGQVFAIECKADQFEAPIIGLNMDVVSKQVHSESYDSNDATNDVPQLLFNTLMYLATFNIGKSRRERVVRDLMFSAAKKKIWNDVTIQFQQ